jgi:hypothetical protein
MWISWRIRYVGGSSVASTPSKVWVLVGMTGAIPPKAVVRDVFSSQHAAEDARSEYLGHTWVEEHEVRDE